MSSTGTRSVCVAKIFCTPQPCDHWLWMTPAAPAASRRRGSACPVKPVRCTRCCHACCAAVRRALSVSAVVCIAHFSQLSSGRHVGCGNEVSTNLPFACGSQVGNEALSAKSGRSRTGERSGRPRGVGGLHARLVPVSVRVRGSQRPLASLLLSTTDHETCD